MYKTTHDIILAVNEALEEKLGKYRKALELGLITQQRYQEIKEQAEYMGQLYRELAEWLRRPIPTPGDFKRIVEQERRSSGQSFSP